jgi:hypothetical protein
MARRRFWSVTKTPWASVSRAAARSTSTGNNAGLQVGILPKSLFKTSGMAPRKGSHFFLSSAFATLLLGLLLIVGLATCASAQTPVPPQWAIAVRHMQANEPAAALPYLEGLVRDYPADAAYRLELAYALYLLGRDGRAQYHFEQARGAVLTPDQRRATNVALSRIAARKVWSARLGFSIEPATNAGKGTAAGSVNLGGIILPVPANLRTRPATGTVVSAGFTYSPRLGRDLQAIVSLDGLVRYYDDPTLRETLVVGRTGLRWSPARNAFVDAGVLLGTTYAAGAHYNDRYGLFGSYSTLLGTRASLRVGVEHYRLKHDTFTLADGPRTQIDVQYSFALSPDTLLRARGYALRANANGPLQSGWQGALTLGGTHAFKGGLVALLDLTAGLDTRDGVNALIGNRRLDRSLAVEAELYNSRYRIGPFTPVLKMKLERNRSNQVIYSYTNQSISFGLRTTF